MSTEIVKELLDLARQVEIALARLEQIAEGIREQAAAVQQLPVRPAPPPYTVAYPRTETAGPAGEVL